MLLLDLVTFTQKMVHCGHRGWTSTHRWVMVLKRCSVGTRGLKVCQEKKKQAIRINCVTPPQTWPFNTRQDGSILSCCLQKILTYHPKVAAQIEAHGTKKYYVILSSSGESVRTIASVSHFLVHKTTSVSDYPVTTGAVCCYSKSALRINVLHIQRCSSANFGCNER